MVGFAWLNLEMHNKLQIIRIYSQIAEKVNLTVKRYTTVSLICRAFPSFSPHVTMFYVLKVSSDIEKRKTDMFTMIRVNKTDFKERRLITKLP